MLLFRKRAAGVWTVSDPLPHPGSPVRGSDKGRPIMALFDLVGRRWVLRVLWELSQSPDPLTFRELKIRCADMSSSVLTRRIAELRDVHLVQRTPQGYTLSQLGNSLIQSLQPLLRWSRAWSAELAASGDAPADTDLDREGR